MRQSSRQQGFALIVALMVMVIIGILATGAIFNAMTSRSVAANDRNNAYAQYMAEAGLNRFKTIAFQSYKFVDAHKDEYVFTASQSDSIRCAGGNLLSIGLDTRRSKNASGKYTIDVPANTPTTFTQTLPDGTQAGYVITLSNSGDQLISEGFVGGATLVTAKARATSALLFTVGGAGPFNNAIFVRGGFNGKAINGNVSVYGSIHSINDSVRVGDPALALGGTAGVYNDYGGEGSNSNVKSIVAQLGGKSNEADLCASIKLKSGDLDVNSGSVSVGTAGNKAKGIYLDTSLGTNGQPKFTINGPTRNLHVQTPSLVSRYNASLDVPFPELPTTFPNDEPNSITLLPTTLGCTWLYASGTLTLPPANPGQNYTCSVGASPNVHTIKWVGANPGYVSFTHPAGQKETIINTRGRDINVTGDVSYEGKAILRAGDSKIDSNRNIRIAGDLVPRGGKFPTDNALAFVSSGTVETDGSQLKIAALIYSQGITTIDKQSVILGSVVADKIDIGGQVPSIAYQPGIEKAFSTLPGQVGGAAALPTIKAYERR